MENTTLKQETKKQDNKTGSTYYELNLDKLDMVTAPSESGNKIELYLKIIVDGGTKLQIPDSDDGHSIRKKDGQIWKIDYPVVFSNHIVVELWESDKGRRKHDDYYGVNMFYTYSKSNPVVYAGKDYEFELYYNITQIS